MTVRNVTKQLLGAEDIACGRGIIEQERGGTLMPIHKLDIAIPVADETELATLDKDKFPRASIGYRNFVVISDQYQEITDITPVQYRLAGTLSEDFPFCINNDVIAKWTGAFPKTLTAPDADFSPVGWEIVTASGNSTLISETQPPLSYGKQGFRWFNPVLPATFVYYDDGTSAQWIEDSAQTADGALRNDLLSSTSTVPIAGVEARAFRAINGVKNLLALANVVQETTGFYAGVSSSSGSFVYQPTYSKALHDGGKYLAPEALAAWDGTYAGLSTLHSWTGTGTGVFERLGNNETVLDYGALANQDLRPVLLHMLGKNLPIKGNGGYFTVSADTTYTGPASIKDITLEFLSGGLKLSANVGSWISCTESKVYSGALDGFEVAGINCSKLTFTGTPTLAIWDVVRVASENQYPWVTVESKAGQMAVVIAVGADYVLLDRELEDGYTYTKVCKYSADKLDLDIKVLNKTDLPAGVGGVLVDLAYYVNAAVKVDALESYYQLVNAQGLFDSEVKLLAKRVRNYSSDQSKWGYGIVDRACESCRFTVDVRSLRHGYTTTHGNAGTEPYRYGEPRNNVITGRGVNCVTPFDSHVNGSDLVFDTCISVGSYGAGMSVRSRNAVLNNCHTTGRTDVGFFVFNNASSTLTVGRGGKTTLNGCSAKEHKRFLRVGHQTENSNTAQPGQRMHVVINDCYAETDPYTDLIYAYNAKVEANNLRLVNTTASSSVTESTYSEGNPIFLRSFVRLKNSEFTGQDVTFVKTASGQKIYPFVIKTDRTLYASAETKVVVDGLELDNSTSKLFTEWGEFVVAQDIAGKKPSDGAIDYTSGLDYTYVVLRNVGANTQSRANVMREDVLAFYKAGSVSARTFGWNPVIAKNFNPSWARTLFIDSSSITLDGSVDTWTLTEKQIDVRGDISPVLDVRITFSNDGAGTGVLRISDIKNLSNLHSTQIIRVYSTNGASNRQVSIKDGVATPNDSANKGFGKAAEFWRNGTSWMRVS